MRMVFAAIITLGAISAAAAAPLSDADCEAVWVMVDVDKNGSIDAKDSEKFIPKANFEKADVDKNGSIDFGEFKVACKQGLVNK